MSRFFAFILFIFTLPALASSTWYVRADGGDRTHCDGKGDTAYVSGTNQHCGFSDFRYLYTDATYGNSGWIIAGGDTVIVRGGPWRVGYNGPNPNDSFGLSPGDPYSAYNPPIPAGTATQPTQILGENSAACSIKTQIFGGYAIATNLNLGNTSNVVISCIELTDHAQCSRVGSPNPNACSSSYPLSDYSTSGIATNANTHDIVLKNVDIHGFTSRGIIGPIGGLFTVDHVRIAFNGMAGWDFDDGSGTPSVNASVNASYLTVEGNGINEEYPITHTFPALSGYDQSSGGYGDGIGTPNTSLNFNCDHCTFYYNTQDGLDLLHTTGSTILVTNSKSYGNMGQQWKLGAMASVTFENNQTIHNCKRMNASIQDALGNWNQYLTNFCRAAGDGIALNINDSGTYKFKNNSFIGYGSTSYDIQCSGTCTKQNIIFQNNIHVGYASPIDGQLPGVFYFGSSVPNNPFLAADHNIYYNMRSIPSSGVGTDPHLTGEPVWVSESSLDAVDFRLTSASTNSIAKVALSDVLIDAAGVTRLNPTSLGAFEYGGAVTITPPTILPPPTHTPITHTITSTITIDGNQVVLSGAYTDPN